MIHISYGMEQEKARYSPFGIDTAEFSFAGRKLWARVVSVYDGDTITIVFPVGETMYRFNARMYGIDTCEMKSKEAANKETALRARNRLIELISGRPLANPTGAVRKDIVRHLAEDTYLVWIECLEFDKYGRVLVKVRKSDDPDLKTFSDILVEEKLAYPYFGETKLTEKEQTTTLS